MRKFLTHNSLWIFDEDASIFCRVPREDAKDVGTTLGAGTVPYAGGWQEYETLEQVGSRTLLGRCGEEHDRWEVKGPNLNDRGEDVLMFWPMSEIVGGETIDPEGGGG